MKKTPDYPTNPDRQKHLPIEPLKDLLSRMFVRKGMFAAEAEIGVSRLLDADLRGITSHGVRTMKRYLDAMDLGDIDPRARIVTLRETAAMAVIDAGKGLGHVGATRAMQMAIAKAQEVGTGTVAVKRGQHFGAAAVYATMAVEENMIGYCTTSTGPATVAAYGSCQPAVANNAFAWGIPSGSGCPFILDMACGESSWGKIDALGQFGLTLPDGWALDEHGAATNDPAAAKTLLPASGARGFGLAFASSALAGALVGSRMPIHKSKRVEADGSEHFFYAIDVSKFIELPQFLDEVDASVADIRGLQPADGFDQVRIPGELEWERAQHNTQVASIALHVDDVTLLEELATGMKFDIPW